MHFLVLVLSLLITLTLSCSQRNGTSQQRSRTDPLPGARASLIDTQGKPVGTATFMESPKGVRIVVETTGVEPGIRGIHIHDRAACEPPSFQSAGEHFNPEGRLHGMLAPEGPHAGDLVNITIGSDGTGRLDVINDRVTLGAGENSLFRPGGTSMVIHADPDDQSTDPSGASGERIACGPIVRVK
ncbi:MAG: superoxide dismutase family protein [Bryobacteraceae bacterium]